MSVMRCDGCEKDVDTDYKDTFDFELGLCEECQERKYYEDSN